MTAAVTCSIGRAVKIARRNWLALSNTSLNQLIDTCAQGQKRAASASRCYWGVLGAGREGCWGVLGCAG